MKEELLNNKVEPSPTPAGANAMFLECAKYLNSLKDKKVIFWPDRGNYDDNEDPASNMLIIGTLIKSEGYAMHNTGSPMLSKLMVNITISRWVGLHVSDLRGYTSNEIVYEIGLSADKTRWDYSVGLPGDISYLKSHVIPFDNYDSCDLPEKYKIALDDINKNILTKLSVFSKRKLYKSEENGA
jgi:hypothetical protein